MSDVAIAVPLAPDHHTHPESRDVEFLFLGAAVALSAHYAVQWLGHTPWWQRVSRKFIWWRPDVPPHSLYGSYAGDSVRYCILASFIHRASCMGILSHCHGSALHLGDSLRSVYFQHK